MIITLVVSFICIGIVSYYLLKTQKRLSKFSELNPIQDQKEVLEKEIAHLKININAETNRMLAERAEAVEKQIGEINKIVNEYDAMSEKSKGLKKEIDKLNLEHSDLISKSELNEYSFYSPKYNLLSSEKYRERLEEIKEKQKNLVLQRKAIRCDHPWTVNGSLKEGEKMTAQNIKLGLSSYNGQVDNIILTVSYKNIDKCEDKIDKINSSLSKMMEANKCYITSEYHKLKIEELYLAFEYEQKVYEEKEEQKKIRMKMQEEEREARAVEKARDEAEKEEKEYLKELTRAKKELEKGHAEERHSLEQKILDLENKLSNATEKKERAISMAMQTKRGHVYIISNVGSFGENVFKIGMTRRLDPQDRVDELGDASVPFEFDVHGMIYSEDAPALENQLHRLFGEHTVNKVNTRKEFFKVSIQEIQKECINYGLVVELTKVAEARDYRQSLEMKNNPYKKAA
jgi:hypothetical protein